MSHVPQNTPISKGNCVVGRYVYGINQKYRLIKFDITKLLLFHDHNDEDNILSKIKFVVDNDCKSALAGYFKNDSLRRDIFNNIIMAKFVHYIIVVGEDDKLLFVNVMNGNVQGIDLGKYECTDFLKSIYDIGVIDDNILYIFNSDMIVIYKLKLNGNNIDIEFIAASSLESEYGNLSQYKYRVSCVVNKGEIIFFLTGCRYVKLSIAFKEKKYYIESCRLNILKKHFLDVKQKVVAAFKKDDKIVIILFAKGTIVAFDHYERKVVGITNPEYVDNRLNNNHDWSIFRSAVLIKETDYYLQCEKICCCYVRNNYTKNVPVALVKMMIKYYKGYQGGELILFTGAMLWMQEIGRKKNHKLSNMVIISAGIYDGKCEYDEIKGSQLHYKECIRGLTY